MLFLGIGKTKGQKQVSAITSAEIGVVSSLAGSKGNKDEGNDRETVISTLFR